MLNVDEVNAFALPGGPMFIYTGLLKAVDNEAQLAGVMGHEMAHVILRHGTHEATKASGLQLLVGGLGALLGGGSSMGGKLAQAGLGLTANSFILKFSRDAETEADAMGSHLMAAAGYDPVQMAKFFQKLARGRAAAAADPLRPSQSGQSRDRDRGRDGHAAGAQVRLRIGRVCAREKGTGAGAQAGQEARDGGGREQSVRRGAPGNSGIPRLLRSSGARAAPAGRNIAARASSLSYPQGWEAEGSGADVTIAPRDGVVTRNGITQIGFGALASVFARGRAATRCRRPPATWCARSAARILRRRGGRDAECPCGRGQRPAHDAARRLALRRSETDAVVTVLRPNGLFYLVWIAPEGDYQRVEPSFRTMLNSVKFE